MSYGVHLFRLASSTTFFKKILVNLLFQSLSPPPKTKQKGKKQKEKEKPLYRLVIVNPILLPTGASDISNTIPTLALNHHIPTPFQNHYPAKPITSTPQKGSLLPDASQLDITVSIASSSVRVKTFSALFKNLCACRIHTELNHLLYPNTTKQISNPHHHPSPLPIHPSIHSPIHPPLAENK